MRLWFVGLLGVATSCPAHASSQVQAQAVPLVGSWKLNLARTHYGKNVDVRRRERFTCDLRDAVLSCTITSVREKGATIVGHFSAHLDGKRARVTGIPDVDAVELRQLDANLDATFYFHEKPVFGYRAYRSTDERSLMIVSVDPVSRVAGTTVVVYDRQ